MIPIALFLSIANIACAEPTFNTDIQTPSVSETSNTDIQTPSVSETTNTDIHTSVSETLDDVNLSDNLLNNYTGISESDLTNWSKVITQLDIFNLNEKSFKFTDYETDEIGLPILDSTVSSEPITREVDKLSYYLILIDKLHSEVVRGGKELPIVEGSIRYHQKNLMKYLADRVEIYYRNLDHIMQLLTAIRLL